MIEGKSDQVKFNMFAFISTFARSLIEIFISLYLFKNGFSIKSILTFYLLENFFAIFLSYIFVRIGEKYKYSTVMYIGIISFIVLQIVLNRLTNSYLYIILISFLYSMYRRGYWVSRRFYISNVIPKNNSSEAFSIVIIISEIASIISGYVGAMVLSNLNMALMTIISSIFLFISVIPLLKIKCESEEHRKIELIKNLKKYDKRNFLAFSMYETNNLLYFIFPIYIAIYIQNTYEIAGSLNAINNIAIILFVLLYGKIIKKKNYFTLSTVLFILICLAKTYTVSYLILVVYFAEGIIKKMQNQSVNKIYFENRDNMDLTHYNLIYQLTESVARIIAVIPLLFISNVKVMIMIVLTIIFIELVIYNCLKKDKNQTDNQP